MKGKLLAEGKCGPKGTEGHREMGAREVRVGNVENREQGSDSLSGVTFWRGASGPQRVPHLRQPCAREAKGVPCTERVACCVVSHSSPHLAHHGQAGRCHPCGRRVLGLCSGLWREADCVS